MGGWLLRVGSLTWLIVHFALTLAYLTPANPLVLSRQSLVDRTIGRYFNQRWNTFAPSPLIGEDSLLARPLTQAEVDAIPAAGLPTNGWYDLSSPLRNGFRHRRWSGLDHVFWPQMNAVRMYVGDSKAALPGPSPRADERILDRPGEDKPKSDVPNEYARAVLGRVASGFMNQDFTDPRYVKVALQIRLQSEIPWFRRGMEPPLIRYLPAGIFTVDRRVRPAAFFDRARPESPVPAK